MFLDCHFGDHVNEKMCAECPIWKCGMWKNIRLCGECVDYPCGIINEYVPIGRENHTKLDELQF